MAHIKVMIIHEDHLDIVGSLLDVGLCGDLDYETLISNSSLSHLRDNGPSADVYIFSDEVLSLETVGFLLPFANSNLARRIFDKKINYKIAKAKVNGSKYTVIDLHI